MKDWKKAVKAVSPLLGSALGGPLGGAAARLISEGLLGKSDSTDSELAAALLDPNNLVKLKSIEKDFEVRLKELDVDLERIGIEDRKSARDLAKSTGVTPQTVLSLVFITGFFSILWVLFVAEITMTESQDRMAYTLLGVLGTTVTVIIKFWFGGSPNDSKNMDHMYNAIPGEKVKR